MSTITLPGRIPATISLVMIRGAGLPGINAVTSDRDGQLVVDFDDVVVRSMTVVRYQHGASPGPADQQADVGRGVDERPQCSQWRHVRTLRCNRGDECSRRLRRYR